MYVISVGNTPNACRSRPGTVFVTLGRGSQFGAEDVFPPLSAPYMGISFSGAGFDIGSIRTRHETSTELSSSSGYDTLPQEYPIPDPGPDTQKKSCH